jgi:uncharacterized integral membrane protein
MNRRQRDRHQQMLLNHVLLVEAAHQHHHQQQQGQNEAYEELKRLIIFAGIFFLFIIIFVLLKFQVSLDDVFKWSPVVWLIGVIICGLIMNIFLQLKKFVKRRRAKRLREQQNLLLSLNLPTSFPCLAPPPHNAECCQCVALMQDSETGRITHPATSILANRRALSLSTSSLISLNPIIIPTYDQVMGGAKTWILSKVPVASAQLEDSTDRRTRLPPTYSTSNIAAELPPPDAVPSTSLDSANSNVDIPPLAPPAYAEAFLNSEQAERCSQSNSSDSPPLLSAQPPLANNRTSQNTGTSSSSLIPSASQVQIL